jgi:prophage antirepressor-like protein
MGDAVNAVALQSFGFGEQLVRAIDRNGAAWFVAKDICSALDIANPSDALKKLDEDEKDGIGLTDDIGRLNTTLIVSEGGMYTLVLRCRDATKPGTLPHRFRKWVTSEVLPAIRRTGQYEPLAVENDEEAEDAPITLDRMPQTPDGFERLRAGLHLVREARIAFGTSAARKAWKWIGLPDLSAAEPMAMPAPNMVLHERNRSVAEWVEERCELVPGHREASQSLYANYEDWCGRNNVQATTWTGFSRYLRDCGFPSVKADRMYRIGLRVKS